MGQITRAACPPRKITVTTMGPVLLRQPLCPESDFVSFIVSFVFDILALGIQRFWVYFLIWVFFVG